MRIGEGDDEGMKDHPMGSGIGPEGDADVERDKLGG